MLLPPDEVDEEDEDEVPHRWSIMKLRRSIGKLKVIKSEVKVTRTYYIRDSKKKTLEDSMKANKASTIRRRRLKKSIPLEEKETVNIVEVEKEVDIDLEVVAAIKETRKKDEVAERTRFSKPMTSGSTGMRRVFDQRIYKKPGMVEMVEYVQGKVLNLDEETLGEILDVLVVGIRTVMNRQPTTEFMIEASKERFNKEMDELRIMLAAKDAEIVYLELQNQKLSSEGPATTDVLATENAKSRYMW
ncbi:hypothetical protein FXO38_26857 [Capsicum annuum]|nr:hypothetical protein FXO37_35752 [Capsicum annuum]KAF3630961.1 hypothetical protein FXO38_26857 [Capsicum annuum]